MAEQYTGPDQVRVYLTGASHATGYQGDHDLSLGNYRSVVAAETLTVLRLNTINGLTINFVAGLNGPGVGSLVAIEDDTLQWTAPGDTAGASVIIANGETKQLPSGDADKYVIVTRTSATALAGSETVQLMDTYGNVIGGSDFTSAEAHANTSKSRAFAFYNLGAATANLYAWFDPVATKVTGGLTTVLGATGSGTLVKTDAFTDCPEFGAVEIRTSGGTFRELCYYTKTNNSTLAIANADRGLFSLGQAAGAAGDILSFPPMALLGFAYAGAGPMEDMTGTGETGVFSATYRTASQESYATGFTFDPTQIFGFVVRRWTRANTPASAREKIVVNYKNIISSITYYGQTRGLYRIENDDYEQFEVFDGQDALPDFDNDTPDVTSATSPIVRTLAVGHTYYSGVRFRNAWDLYGPPALNILVVAANGTGQLPNPNGPTVVSLKGNSEGKVVISAVYYPMQEAETWDDIIARRATIWLIYLTADGTDPLLQTPIESDMANIMAPEVLEYTSAAAYLDGAPITVVVRTRREDDYIQAVTSITRSGTTATVTLTAHGWVTGMTIVHTGADQSEYNIAAVITVTDANTYTYTVAGSPLSPATSLNSNGIFAALNSALNSDSTNTTTATLTLDLCGPNRPTGVAMYGRAAGVYVSPSTMADTDTIVDAGANIYWEQKVGETLLWYNTEIVFRIRYRSDGDATNGFYTFYNLINATVSGAGTAVPLEIVVAASEWYVVVNGTRRLKIDPTANTITVASVDQLTAPSECCESAPAVRQYAATCIQLFDPVTQEYATPMSLMSDGSLRTLVPWIQKADQAEVLA